MANAVRLLLSLSGRPLRIWRDKQMTFQFKCPQGCLLSGEESQAGQTISCPVCGQSFIIPQPVTTSTPAPDPPAPAAVESPQPEAETPEQPEPEEEIVLLHIPCPNGHVLETPREMIGQEVLCPHCNAQFELHETESVEYKERREFERRRREERVGNAWLNWAVVFAVLVILGFAFLLISSAMDNS